MLAIRVVTGLAAAALAAVLLEHYGLASQPSSLPQPRAPRSPQPAPGPGASHIFWGLQVTQREHGAGVGAEPARRGETRAVSAAAPLQRTQTPGWAFCPSLGGRGLFMYCFLAFSVRFERAAGSPAVWAFSS